MWLRLEDVRQQLSSALAGHARATRQGAELMLRLRLCRRQLSSAWCSARRLTRANARLLTDHAAGAGMLQTGQQVRGTQWCVRGSVCARVMLQTGQHVCGTKGCVHACVCVCASSYLLYTVLVVYLLLLHTCFMEQLFVDYVATSSHLRAGNAVMQCVCVMFLGEDVGFIDGACSG